MLFRKSVARLRRKNVRKLFQNFIGSEWYLHVQQTGIRIDRQPSVNKYDQETEVTVVSITMLLIDDKVGNVSCSHVFDMNTIKIP